MPLVRLLQQSYKDASYMLASKSRDIDTIHIEKQKR